MGILDLQMQYLTAKELFRLLITTKKLLKTVNFQKDNEANINQKLGEKHENDAVENEEDKWRNWLNERKISWLNMTHSPFSSCIKDDEGH